MIFQIISYHVYNLMYIKINLQHTKYIFCVLCGLFHFKLLGFSGWCLGWQLFQRCRCFFKTAENFLHVLSPFHNNSKMCVSGVRLLYCLSNSGPVCVCVSFFIWSNFPTSKIGFSLNFHYSKSWLLTFSSDSFKRGAWERGWAGLVADPIKFFFYWDNWDFRETRRLLDEWTIFPRALSSFLSPCRCN